MAKGTVNKAIIVGRLGGDPQLRLTASGGTVATMSVATEEQWKTPAGEIQSQTEWHRVTLFGRLADLAAQYLKKGAKVYLEGRIQTRKWQDKTGAEHLSPEIVAEELQFLDSKSS